MQEVFSSFNKVIVKKKNSQEVFTGLLEVENKMLVGRFTRHKITLFRSLRNCLFCFFFCYLLVEFKVYPPCSFH